MSVVFRIHLTLFVILAGSLSASLSDDRGETVCDVLGVQHKMCVCVRYANLASFPPLLRHRCSSRRCLLIRRTLEGSTCR